MDIVTRKKLNILIQLALSDKDLSAEERELIYRIARERNYPIEDLEALIEHPEPIGTLGALSETQKVDYLLSSIELVLVDNRVSTSEMVMSQQIAIKLGFFKHVVNHLLTNFGKMPVNELQLSNFRQI